MKNFQALTNNELLRVRGGHHAESGTDKKKETPPPPPPTTFKSGDSGGPM